jgi:hypothetical protein
MNEELARRARERASRTGRSFTQFIEQAVSGYLAKADKPRRRKKFVLPIAGNPKKKMTWETYQAEVDQGQLEDDLRSLGLSPDEDAA